MMLPGGRLVSLRERSRYVLLSNVVEVNGRRYIRPAPTTYEHQWLWDSCFHAIVNLHLDPELSRAELRSLLSLQFQEGPDAGMVPHMGYYDGTGTALWGRPYTSTITQPPIIADAVLLTYQTTGDLVFVKEILPGLKAYYDWLARRRDPDGDHLVSLIHPWESGWDSSPRWDHYTGIDHRDSEALKRWRHDLVARIAAHRWDVAAIADAGLYTPVAIDYNCLYAANLESLAKLLTAAGCCDQATQYGERAEAVRQAINAKMWDESVGYYWDLVDGRREKQIKVLTPAGFMALYGGVASPEQAETLVRLLTDPAHFWTSFPVPSVAISEPTYRPSVYWRGNVWPSINWLIIRGLERYGYTDLATAMATRFVNLVCTHGFREYFHPETGEGYGPVRQSWATLALDLELASRRGDEPKYAR